MDRLLAVLAVLPVEGDGPKIRQPAAEPRSRPTIHDMNHFTITAEDREATLRFYCGLLGLKEGHRSDLGFPGSWLYADDRSQAVQHVYWESEPNRGRGSSPAAGRRQLR